MDHCEICPGGKSVHNSSHGNPSESVGLWRALTTPRICPMSRVEQTPVAFLRHDEII